VRVDEAELVSELCWRENTEGPAVLARACADHGVAMVTFSSDLVFDGRQSAPYVETDAVAPLNAYGRSKAAVEQRVGDALPSALVIRTSAFFGPWDEHNLVTRALNELESGHSFAAANDAIVSPTFVPDLVNSTLDLLIDNERGIWHLANAGAITWSDLVLQAAALAGVNTARFEARALAELALPAPRPVYSVLGSSRAVLLPSLDDALARYVRARDSTSRLATA
jgi:dTDP-4-dehydrorhamnose reductase